MVAPSNPGTEGLPARVIVLKKLDRTGPYKPGRVLEWDPKLKLWLTPDRRWECNERFLRERWGRFFGPAPAEQLTLL